MKYRLESNHEWRFNSDQFPPHKDPGWRPFGSYNPGKEFDELDAANRALTLNSNMARCIWPIRVIDSEGNVHSWYDPEQDMRLPGPRHRSIEKNAAQLWEAAGKPEGKDLDFWLEAERKIKDDDHGLFLNVGVGSD